MFQKKYFIIFALIMALECEIFYLLLSCLLDSPFPGNDRKAEMLDCNVRISTNR
ncbi:MAG TPA: hypothetical protein PL110_05380 [Candidatus Eremiobacteraeota bacterium]|nr:hypothetical protein [Candidatus Eremiobacteraeota bacterium]